MSESESEREDADTVDAKAAQPTSEATKQTRTENLPKIGPLEYKTYNLSGFPHLAKPIIFNHKDFSPSFKDKDFQPNKRKGTSGDVERLKEVFKSLNCTTPEVHTNMKAADIKDTLYKVSQDNHDDYACIIVVVLTHGEENYLYANDEKYETSKLWEPFIKTSQQNQTTTGKPKLFFIQACRGEQLDESHDVVDAIGYSAQEPTLKKIPRCADFFIAHSSFYGYMSVRNELYGSWFIQTLCEAFNLHKNQLDLIQIMTIVKYDIAYNRTYGKENKKQIPCTETTLTKTLFLTKTALDYNSAEAKGLSNRDATDSARSHDGRHQPTQNLKEMQPSGLDHTNPKLLFFAVILFVLLNVFVELITNRPVQYNCHCNYPMPPTV